MDELDGLLLRYDDRDTDGFGKLAAEVRFRGFAGASSVWVSDADVARFADQLTTYPLNDSQFSISAGYGENEDFEERVGLGVRAVGRRGQVGVTARLAAPIDYSNLPGVPLDQVRVEVLTSYEALGRFSIELARLVAGTADDARLDAEVFD